MSIPCGSRSTNDLNLALLYAAARGFHAQLLTVQPTATTSAVQSADASARRYWHSNLQAQSAAPRLRVRKSTAAFRVWHPFCRPYRRTPDLHGGPAHPCTCIEEHTLLAATPTRSCAIWHFARFAAYVHAHTRWNRWRLHFDLINIADLALRVSDLQECKSVH